MQLVQHLKYFQSLGFQSAAGLGFNILCDQSFTERLNIGILILRSILVMYRKAHSNTLLLSEVTDSADEILARLEVERLEVN